MIAMETKGDLGSLSSPDWQSKMEDESLNSLCMDGESHDGK